MPKEINGLPLHPLVVHAVVVLVPLLALVAVLFLVPRFRRSMRWPMVLLALVALGSTFVARESGKDLKDNIVPPGTQPSELLDAIDEHQDLADQLWYLVIAFVIVVLIAAYVLRPDDEFGPFPGRRGDSENEEGAATLDSVIRAVVATLVIVGAVAVVVQTVRAGEQGTRAVWNPTGDADFGIAAVERSP
jgi:TRAP-type uncharacterized transport system fused permease subunit